MCQFSSTSWILFPLAVYFILWPKPGAITDQHWCVIKRVTVRNSGGLCEGSNGLLLSVKYDLWIRNMIHIEHISKLQSSQQSINENWALNDRHKSIIRLLELIQSNYWCLIRQFPNLSTDWNICLIVSFTERTQSKWAIGSHVPASYLPGVGPIPVHSVAVWHDLGSRFLTVNTRPNDKDEEEDRFHLRHLSRQSKTMTVSSLLWV